METELSLDTIRIIEYGKRENIRLDTLRKLCDLYDLSIGEVLREMGV
ncbi:helix-turn-helix domain-containing protein [bacterium]|nr:helix-turn-helix domain-containing protein [bacterium]MBT3580710.1 helix-turn-helix domain-containing protein [bacterium]MBT4551787.1 helix-turn-helix domain-containing protein [bacterium]MBT7087947.1 helix-turn-helix domain-containing protein [bacterium]